jgi:hypothetical protein
MCGYVLIGISNEKSSSRIVISNVMLCSLIKWVPTFIILDQPPVSIVIEEAGLQWEQQFCPKCLYLPAKLRGVV